MAKKTLEEKIKRVVCWTIGLSILYFVIGAFLKSDGPVFDLNKTYELLKDTLTLTAAFLAPVAAFVLFSDWRVEHSVKSLHSKIDEIKKQTQEIEDTLNKYMKTIFNTNWLDAESFTDAKENQQLFNQLTSLSRLRLDFSSIDDNTKNFQELLDLFGESALKAKSSLDMMYYSRFERKRLEKKPDTSIGYEDEIKFHLKLFKKHWDSFEINFPKIQSLNDQLIFVGNKIKDEI